MIKLKNAFKRVLGCLYIPDKFYKIYFGPLKGLKLLFRKDVNYFEIWGLWEKENFTLLSKVFKETGILNKPITVADVGANMGYYSMFFSNVLHKDSTIVAFEPSESINGVLQKNIVGNNLNNVSIYNTACSDKIGEIDFYLGENHHTSSIDPEWANNVSEGKKVKVPSTTIDYFFGASGFKYPDLIKMDIEGGVFMPSWVLKIVLQLRDHLFLLSHIHR